MKNLIFILSLMFLPFGIQAQSFIGAWEGYHISEQGQKLKTVVIFSDVYQVMSRYDAATGQFIMTNGGTWTVDGDIVTETVEFDSNNPKRVGTQVSFKVVITDTTLSIVDSDMQLKRIDTGVPGKLQGAWLMSGRVRDGKTQQRDINKPRKTMKILSGTRFQWIAYNTETKQFMGTGGGNYTTIDGKYTENIEFFSKDNAKVGLELTFDFSLVGGKWNHSGFSSKGDPIYEIWSLRK